jgi:hypothetical protein
MAEEHKTDTESSEAAKKEDLKDIPLHSLKMTQLIELDACTRCEGSHHSEAQSHRLSEDRQSAAGISGENHSQ